MAASLAISALIAALVSLFILHMAMSHNPQGEFVDHRTGQMVWSTVSWLFSAFFFISFVIAWIPVACAIVVLRSLRQDGRDFAVAGEQGCPPPIFTPVTPAAMNSWWDDDPLTVQDIYLRVGSERHRAELFRWESDDDDQMNLKLVFKNRVVESSSPYNYFDALSKLRQQLEEMDTLLECYGACLNVYPSQMSASMGVGDMAYKMTMGKYARSEDIVNIFDSGPDMI